MPNHGRGRMPRHLNAKRPDDVPPLTVEEAHTEPDEAGDRKSKHNCLSWVDLKTDLAWCRFPGCPVHYEKNSRFKVNEHYDKVHLGARRARPFLCPLCDYQAQSFRRHEVIHRRARYPCLLKCGRTWFSRKSGKEWSNHVKKYCPLRKPPRGNLYGRTWIEAHEPHSRPHFDKEVQRVEGDAPAQPVQADTFDFNAPLDQAQSPVDGSQQTDSNDSESASHRSQTAHPTQAHAREFSSDSAHRSHSFVFPTPAHFVPMAPTPHRASNVPPFSSSNAPRTTYDFTPEQRHLYHPGQIPSTFSGVRWTHDRGHASSLLHPHPFSHTPVPSHSDVYQHRSVANSIQFHAQARQPTSQNPVVFDLRTQQNQSYGDPYSVVDYSSREPSSHDSFDLYHHEHPTFPQEYDHFHNPQLDHFLEQIPMTFDDRALTHSWSSPHERLHPYSSQSVAAPDYGRSSVATQVQSVPRSREIDFDSFHHDGATSGDFPMDPRVVWDYPEPTTESQHWNPQEWSN
ncbi:hypothetical protein JCM16303_006300 [Sporobolomyces ruberrimus]